MTLPGLSENKPLRSSFLERIGLLFSNPLKLFGELSGKPDFQWPVIFISLYVVFSIPMARFQLDRLSESNPDLIRNPGGIAAIGIIAYSVFVTLFRILAGWFIQTGLYILCAMILKKGYIKFKTLLSMIGYTLIANALSYIFQGALVMMTGILPMIGLEAVFNMEGQPTIIQNFIRAVNPFTLGGLVLTVFALIQGLKISRNQAIVVTLVIWLLGFGLRLIGL
jgi:hypothetical protein